MACLALLVLWTGAAVGQDGAASSAVAHIRLSDFTILPSFTSHLPLVVIDPEENKPFGTQMAARLRIHDSGAGVNSPNDPPTASIAVDMQRSTAAMANGKYIFGLKKTDDGTVELAGLPADSEWRLHGSLQDKCMLRNGLAYALGRVIYPDIAPDTRYCEVLVRQGAGYRYEGIYILAGGAERIKRAVTAGDPVFLKRIIGQERRGDHIVRVGSKIFSVMQPVPGGLAPRALPMEDRRRLSIELEKLESVLHSVHPSTFLEYQKQLDEASVVDFFILNTLTMNAISAPAPFILMRDEKGRLHYLPEWDFDQALDNAPDRDRPLPFELEPEDISPPSVLSRRVPVWRTLEQGGDISDLRMYPIFQAFSGDRYLWLDRLFLSRSFLTKLYNRYHELRRGGLAPARIAETTDAITMRLGAAIERDWTRWEDEYASESGLYALMPYYDDEMEEHNRQTTAPSEELVKINHTLREQDAFILRQLDELEWMRADLFDKSTSGTRQAGYAFLTLIFMFILTHLLTRRL